MNPLSLYPKHNGGWKGTPFTLVLLYAAVAEWYTRQLEVLVGESP